MQASLRRHSRALSLFIGLLFLAAPAWAAEKVTARFRADDYQIDAELVPHSHKITARAEVKFTALDDLNVATFELNNALRVTKVMDANGKTLNAERITQDFTVRVPLNGELAKDASTVLTFDYEGTLDSADESPVEGLKLASINDDTSYLLYAARWFPVNGYGINRFSATMNITVPAHMVVIGSGTSSVNAASSKQRASDGYPARPTSSSGRSQAFPAPSSPAAFRNSKAMKPASICTSSSSLRIRIWVRLIWTPRFRSLRTT